MTGAQSFRVQYSSGVILLSIGIAFIGAYVGIVLFEQFRLCQKDKQPKLLNKHTLMWLIATSIGGVAIWTMHFVGMSALTLTDPYGETISINYRIDLTFLSLIVVILLCYAGFYLSSRDGVYLSDTVDTVEEFKRGATKMSIVELKAMRHKNHVLFITLFKRMDSIVAGGATTAAGVCVMHYIGMESMMIENGRMTWNVGIVAASVVIAVVAATAAFWILFRLLALYPHYEMLRIASAAVASIAVNGMHYTGMAALEVRYVSDVSHSHHDVHRAITMHQSTASTGALVAAMIFLWLVIILVIADLRAWFYNSSQIVRRTDHMVETIKTELVGMQGFAPALVQSSALDILRRLPDRYKHIRDYDHYKSTAWTTTRYNSARKSQQSSISRGSRFSRRGLLARDRSISASIQSTKSADGAAVKPGASFGYSDHLVSAKPPPIIGDSSSATATVTAPLAYQQSMMTQQGTTGETAVNSAPVSVRMKSFGPTTIVGAAPLTGLKEEVLEIPFIKTADEDDCDCDSVVDQPVSQKTSSEPMLLPTSFTLRGVSKRIVTEG